MKVLEFSRYALSSCIVAALLAGCGGSQPPITAPGAMPQARAMVAHTDRALPTTLNIGKLKADLFVDDSSHDAVEILKNGTWHNLGSITQGIAYPNGNWVDSRRNLYVTNAFDSSAYISEYGRSGKLKFTYSSGMKFPAAVATDSEGNVYEADSFTGVNEYRQGSNVVVASCPQLGGGQRGIAVDSHRNVFVTYGNGSDAGAIEEYSGGLAGCPAKTLGVALGLPGGIALDKNANLLVCDETNRSVDVIASPYSQISGYLGSDYLYPLDVSINQDNSQAYVTDWGDIEVDVLSYPSGSKIATLNSNNGIRQPTGAVDGSNFVP